MPLKPFEDWLEGLWVDIRKEVWPFLATITVKEFGFDTVWNRTMRQNEFPFDKAIIGEDFGSGLHIWEFEYYKNQHNYEFEYRYEIVSMHTKGGIILNSVEDMKRFLLE